MSTNNYISKIKICNFKGYKENPEDDNYFTLAIPYDEKPHALIYGANGAGKSSLYQAINYFFNYQSLADLYMANQPSFSEEEKEARDEEFRRNLVNSASDSTEFNIVLNDTIENAHELDIQAFCFAPFDFELFDYIAFTDFVQQSYLPHDNDLDEFSKEHAPTVAEKVTEVLNNQFQEKSLSISFNIEGDYNLIVKDADRFPSGITKDFKNFLNEGKLNLIKTLCMFEIFKILKSREKTNLIVLDDFVSSLDDINRTELLRYLFEQVLEGSPVIRYQLIILTHHTHFYNRIKFAISETYPEHKSKWSFFRLYEHDNYINAFSEDTIDFNKEFNELNKRLESQDANQCLPSIGNDIRKLSEIMGYLVAETLQLSPKTSIEDILQLSNIGKNPFYFKRERVNKKIVTKLAVHLLEDIKELLEDSNQNELKTQLEAKIAEYQSTENLEIIDTILQQFRLIKLYRKAALHSLSHGQVEEVNYSVSNLKASIKILKEVNILRKKVNKSN